VAEAGTAQSGWPRAFALAALALYVPPLLPLALTDVLEHGHCLRLYLRLYPVLAGALPGTWACTASGLQSTASDALFVLVAGAVTLAVLWGTAFALRRWRRAGPLVAAGVALGVAALAMGTVGVLRA